MIQTIETKLSGVFIFPFIASVLISLAGVAVENYALAVLSFLLTLLLAKVPVKCILGDSDCHEKMS